MKNNQLNATHFLPRGVEPHGLNPRARPDRWTACHKDYHADAAMCIIPGDLTDQGHRKAYNDFREILQKLPMPYHPLIGNHDHREIFTEIFPEVPCDEYGFVQQMLTTEQGNFLLLDTVQHKNDEGIYCENRGAWLRIKLEESRCENVYLFMHHPPFKIGIPALDRIKILDGE